MQTKQWSWAIVAIVAIFAHVDSFVVPYTSRNAQLSKPAVRLETSSTPSDIYTIQILMSDTGGGHRASANALRDAFDILHPGKIQCDIVDIYTDYGPFWPYNDYVGLYKLMAEYSFLWDWFYHFGATPLGMWLNELLLESFCFEPFMECVNRPSGSTAKRADMVISVHPLCQDIPLKILAHLDSRGTTRGKEGRTTPFATVVTDLGGAHPTWFNPGVDKCFVPSSVLNKAAQDRNVQPYQIVQYGLPIRKGFWKESSFDETAPKGNTVSNLVASLSGSATETATDSNREELRTALGLDLKLPAVLVVGGGDGMGGIVDIAKSLGEKLGAGKDLPAYQMIVVCGNNQAAKQALSSNDWGQGVKVYIQGFVNNMDEWMRASDALVTKAGPGTIAEASICGLPCMLFSFL